MKTLRGLILYVVIGAVFAVLLSNAYRNECGSHIGQDEFEFLMFAWPSLPVIGLLADDPDSPDLDDGRPGYCEEQYEQL